jgi:hypothetical protein
MELRVGVDVEGSCRQGVRSMLQAERQEVTGGWNELHSKDFHSFLSSLSTMAIK